MFGHNSFNFSAPYKSEGSGVVSDESLIVENFLLSITPMPEMDTRSAENYTNTKIYHRDSGR